MFLTEEIETRWKDVIESKKMAPITDPYRRAVVTQLLENQSVEGRAINESNNTTQVDNFDPILMTLVRRSMPNLLAFDMFGVQPMNSPASLIFAMRSIYGSAVAGPHGVPGDSRPGFTTGGSNAAAWQVAGSAPNEALFNDANTAFSGTGTHDPENDLFGTGVATVVAEVYGRGLSGDGDFNEMSFTIEKSNVVAKTRALKAQFTLELQQDLKRVHGLDAETEIANILSAEILTEINREGIYTMRKAAKLAAGSPLFSNGSVVTDSAGVVQVGSAGLFDIEANTDGRWMEEKYKSLLVRIGKESNKIAKETRRGRGNFIVCSSDVAVVLDLTGKMTYAPAIENDLKVDDTGPTFVGRLQGRYDVYIDPFIAHDEVIVGYKGSTPYDAGMFYCPYVPLQMMKAVGENDFQPRLAFKTRYGMVANPFTTLEAHGNTYFRKFIVTNL